MVVCLHGLGRAASDWDAVRAGLETFGEVLTPTLPGMQGEALKVAGAAIGPGAIVIGHSMGGVLALRLAREAPRPPRAIVLTSCFFPPARNGRGTLSSFRDYAGHRIAYLRSTPPSRPRGDATSRTGTAGALAGLVRMALRRGEFDLAAGSVAAPVLVVHCRDDHHVPVDFALAAAARQPGWDLHILDDGGHYPQIERPAAWLEAVTPWLSELPAPKLPS